jgi:hypothetical protein
MHCDVTVTFAKGAAAPGRRGRLSPAQTLWHAAAAPATSQRPGHQRRWRMRLPMTVGQSLICMTGDDCRAISSCTSWLWEASALHSQSLSHRQHTSPHATCSCQDTAPHLVIRSSSRQS